MSSQNNNSSRNTFKGKAVEEKDFPGNNFAGEAFDENDFGKKSSVKNASEENNAERNTSKKEETVKKETVSNTGSASSGKSGQVEKSSARHTVYSARRLTLSAILCALALIFSYIEAIFPFNPGIPGVKLGLANLVVIIALYRMDARYAFVINLLRVLMAGLLFTGIFGMLYSLAGSLVSFLIMYLCKKTNLFSIIGVSMAGGVAHNFGQLCIAVFIVSSGTLFYYLPVLILSGMAAGILIGIAAYILIRRIPKQLFRA